jgi:hypothetical protein
MAPERGGEQDSDDRGAQGNGDAGKAAEGSWNFHLI